jgi:hypothetical protein
VLWCSGDALGIMVESRMSCIASSMDPGAGKASMAMSFFKL